MDQILCKVIAVSFVLSLIAVVDKVAGQEKVKFPVNASSKTLGYSPLWVAHRQGFFDQQGMDVPLVLTANRVDTALIAVPLSSDEANLERVKAVIQIMAERGQLKPPLSSPNKYIDHSYLEEALKELGRR